MPHGGESVPVSLPANSTTDRQNKSNIAINSPHVTKPFLPSSLCHSDRQQRKKCQWKLENNMWTEGNVKVGVGRDALLSLDPSPPEGSKYFQNATRPPEYLFILTFYQGTLWWKGTGNVIWCYSLILCILSLFLNSLMSNTSFAFILSFTEIITLSYISCTTISRRSFYVQCT